MRVLLAACLLLASCAAVAGVPDASPCNAPLPVITAVSCFVALDAGAE